MQCVVSAGAVWNMRPRQCVVREVTASASPGERPLTTLGQSPAPILLNHPAGGRRSLGQVPPGRGGRCPIRLLYPRHVLGVAPQRLGRRYLHQWVMYLLLRRRYLPQWRMYLLLRRRHRNLWVMYLQLMRRRYLRLWVMHLLL